ncbi:MAG: response regulator transcription factor [Psychromonas sp.]|nr:response regulator transcription factor [Alteromonadales bacterium]MCP5079449.1 response regulator transcription factor [Psychromonas sp.]
MLILLAEDETDLAELTIDYLETESIECDYASDGAMAINLINENSYDVIVLDINMPKLDGFSVCRQLKENHNNTPVLFLSARDALDDKLAGFELGADDYLTKPFELKELTARLKVLAQRQSKSTSEFQLDTLVVNFQQRIANRAQRKLTLSANQWQALELLAQNSPDILSRTRLENTIWPDQQANKDMLKMLLYRLRNIIDNEGDLPLLHTIKGLGIALKAEHCG